MENMPRRYWRFLICVYAITLLIIVPYLTKDIPYSIFFKMTFNTESIEKRAADVNEDRVQAATGYIQSLDSTNSSHFYQNIWRERRYDTVIAIVTVSREMENGVKPGYLTQTATMFDQIIKSSKHSSSYFLFLCNTDNRPVDHSEARTLGNYMPFVELYGKNDGKMVIGGNMFTPLLKSGTRSSSFKTSSTSSRTWKEKNDYTFCLQTASDLKTEKILIVQDDAVPRKDLLDVLSVLINSRLRYSYRNDEDRTSKLAFLKLYFPQRILGYYNHVIFVFEILAIGLIGGALSVLINLLINHTFGVIRRVSTHEAYVSYFVGFLFFAILCQAIGRQNIQELRRISPDLYTLRSAHSCCNPAILYFSSFVPVLIKFLQTSQDTGNYDLVMADFMASQRNWLSYYTEPNLFSHVGMYSSLRPGEHTAPEDYLFPLDFG